MHVPRVLSTQSSLYKKMPDAATATIPLNQGALGEVTPAAYLPGGVIAQHCGITMDCQQQRGHKAPPPQAIPPGAPSAHHALTTSCGPLTPLTPPPRAMTFFSAANTGSGPAPAQQTSPAFIAIETLCEHLPTNTRESCFNSGASLFKFFNIL